MIGFLTGIVHRKQPPFLWIDVNGVGYEIEAPMSTFYVLPKEGEQATLFIHTHVREDALHLFGFASDSEKSLYRTLIKVNGVGGKMALSILTAMSVHEFVKLVEAENALGLTKIPGVGKKTAERLVIEMRDKLSHLSEGSETARITEEASNNEQPILVSHESSAIDALVALGYKQNQAEKMVASAIKGLENPTLEEIIKTSLQAVKI